MEQMDIKQRLIEMLANVFPDVGIDKDVLGYVDLIDDLGMDSITFISVVVEIESVFGIIVPDDMLMIENFRNVDAIIRIVEANKKKLEIID